MIGKRLLGFVIAVLILSLAGCTPKATPTQEQVSEEATEATDGEATPTPKVEATPTKGSIIVPPILGSTPEPQRIERGTTFTFEDGVMIRYGSPVLENDTFVSVSPQGYILDKTGTLPNMIGPPFGDDEIGIYDTFNMRYWARIEHHDDKGYVIVNRY